MTPQDPQQRALIDLLEADARARAGDLEMPSPETLLAYHQGELAPEEEARIGRLLVASPAAARRLLDLVELAEARPPAAAEPADFAAEAAWRQLERRLDAPPAGSRRPAPKLWIGLAAGFALLALGLVYRDVVRESRLRQPVANLASLELSKVRSATLPSLALKRGEPIRIVLAPEEVCPVYQAELRRAGDSGLRRVDDLFPDERGRLTLLLPTIEPGEYQLGLFGCEPSRELESLPFTIVLQGRGNG